MVWAEITYIRCHTVNGYMSNHDSVIELPMARTRVMPCKRLSPAHHENVQSILDGWLRGMCQSHKLIQLINAGYALGTTLRKGASLFLTRTRTPTCTHAHVILPILLPYITEFLPTHLTHPDLHLLLVFVGQWAYAGIRSSFAYLRPHHPYAHLDYAEAGILASSPTLASVMCLLTGCGWMLLLDSMDAPGDFSAWIC